jgi:hypothetical protein
MKPALAVILLPLVLVAGANTARESKEGNCNDDHGHLCWESSADPSKMDGDWKYARSVTNKSQELRCHVVWENPSSGFKWKSLLEAPDTQNPGTFITDMPPEEAGGKIIYNGGKQAGDASAKAPAWAPKTKEAAAPSHFSSEAEVAFMLHGEGVKLQIDGSCLVMKDDARIDYSIKLKQKKGGTAIGTSDIKFRWTTADKMLKAPLAMRGEINTELIVTFEQVKSDKSFSFSATAKIPDSKNPSLLIGSLQVLDREGNILAEAPLPAFGVGKKD